MAAQKQSAVKRPMDHSRSSESPRIQVSNFIVFTGDFNLAVEAAKKAAEQINSNAALPKEMRSVIRSGSATVNNQKDKRLMRVFWQLK